jgi:hypothetical protein
VNNNLIKSCLALIGFKETENRNQRVLKQNTRKIIILTVRENIKILIFSK